MMHRIPLLWSMYGHCNVEADTLEQAMKTALAPETPLPDGSYVEGSAQVDMEALRMEATAPEGRELSFSLAWALQRLAAMREETEREIGKPTLNDGARTAWYWRYIGSLDLAYQLGIISDDRRQALYREVEHLKPQQAGAEKAEPGQPPTEDGAVEPCGMCSNARVCPELTEENDRSYYGVGTGERGYRLMVESGGGRPVAITAERWSEKRQRWELVGFYRPRYCPNCGRPLTEYDGAAGQETP